MKAAMMRAWTIYDRPADFPHNAVARLWAISALGAFPTDEVIVAPSLEQLRALMPPGLVCVPRSEDDDPQIVEVWL